VSCRRYLALSQKFLLQIDDLTDMVIRVAGTRQNLPESGRTVGAFGTISCRPVAVRLRKDRGNGGAYSVIEGLQKLFFGLATITEFRISVTDILRSSDLCADVIV
jgi:hypothetical protein